MTKTHLIKSIKPRIEEVYLPFPPTSFNPMLRQHRIKQHGINKTYQHNLIFYLLDIEPFTSKIYLEWEWTFYCSKAKFLRRDGENVSSPGSKLILDALVKQGILRDDSCKYIASPVLHWYGFDPEIDRVQTGETGQVMLRLSEIPLYRGEFIHLENC